MWWILLALPLIAASADVQVAVHVPRDSGYVTGDLLTVEAEVEVPGGLRLEPRSVTGGALPEWLELRGATWSEERTSARARYRFRWTYQIFLVPDRAARAEIPGRALRFLAQDGIHEVRIPPTSILMAPLTDLRSSLEPDEQPTPPSDVGIRLHVASLVLLCLSLVAVEVVRRRRERKLVLVQALQELRRTSTPKEAFLVLHRALERKAGQALHRHRLDPLFARWPPSRGVRSTLESFFALSEAMFYRDSGSPPEPTRAWIQELARRLAELERRDGALKWPWSSGTPPS
jgi:mxaA protein